MPAAPDEVRFYATMHPPFNELQTLCLVGRAKSLHRSIVYLLLERFCAFVSLHIIGVSNSIFLKRTDQQGASGDLTPFARQPFSGLGSPQSAVAG